jgi:hypothetical protein
MNKVGYMQPIIKLITLDYDNNPVDCIVTEHGLLTTYDLTIGHLVITVKHIPGSNLTAVSRDNKKTKGFVTFGDICEIKEFVEMLLTPFHEMGLKYKKYRDLITHNPPFEVLYKGAVVKTTLMEVKAYLVKHFMTPEYFFFDFYHTGNYRNFGVSERFIKSMVDRHTMQGCHGTYEILRNEPNMIETLTRAGFYCIYDDNGLVFSNSDVFQFSKMPEEGGTSRFIKVYMKTYYRVLHAVLSGKYVCFTNVI